MVERIGSITFAGIAIGAFSHRVFISHQASLVPQLFTLTSADSTDLQRRQRMQSYIVKFHSMGVNLSHQ